MPFKHLLHFLCFFVFMSIFSAPLLWAAADAPGCTSAQCHSTRQDNANTHPADRSCTNCHQPDTSTHPDNTSPNVTTTPTPCTGCHDDITDHDYLHPPVAASDCLACHLVHGEKRNNYIGEQEKLFCYNCHNTVIAEGETVLHGDISKNKCSSCHTAHGSRYPSLLRENFSLEFFNDYSEEAYKLCFRCHKIDLLLHPTTSYNTKFRDGKKNLHYIHVNRKTKGRSCSACHKTHASRLPHLLADTVSFGNWQMPINYTETAGGGRCSPGCHATRSYDRALGRK